jgi:ATP-binding cassette, subfamily B, multidrug efflux pump
MSLFRKVFLIHLKLKFFIIFISLISAGLGLFSAYYQKIFLHDLTLKTLFISGFVMLFFFLGNQLTTYLCQLEASKTQAQVAVYLYRHILFLNSTAKRHKTNGELLSYYTTDIPSLTMWLEQTLPFTLTTFIPLILTPIFLFYSYHVSFIASYSVVFLLLLINVLMAKRQSFFFGRFKILAGERMSFVNEWLQNIKNLKLYGWVESFEKQIFLKRETETANRIQMVTNGQMMNSISSSVTYWLNLAVLGYIGFHFIEPLTTADVMVLIWVVGVFLSRPLRQLPWLMTMFFDAKTSYSRLEKVFSLSNLEPSILKPEFSAENQSLIIENLNLRDQDQQLLKKINLTINQGEIVGLLGPVGSGKSLLIKSIILDTPFQADRFKSSAVSYLPQEPFIFSSTISQNLSFSYNDDIDILRAEASLKKAEFDLHGKNDRTLFSTVVGERGLNLSGGQKQRLHLARLFHQKNRFFVLDDPFSALDIAVEKKLIQQILHLKSTGDTFLISSQRDTFLQYCDRVIYMEHGEIIFNGSFSDYRLHAESISL